LRTIAVRCLPSNGRADEANTIEEAVASGDHAIKGRRVLPPMRMSKQLSSQWAGEYSTHGDERFPPNGPARRSPTTH
jgi:hypothetical protein